MDFFFGEDNEIIGYMTPEGIEEFFGDPTNEISFR
jgi:hypothetical protein